MASIRAFAAIALVAAALVSSPARAKAQDLGNLAAYTALTFTPIGGLVPLPPPSGTNRGSAFLFRYGNLDTEDNSLHNLAVGGDFGTGPGRLGLTLGYTSCDGCDGNIMVGVDYTVSLTQDVVSVGLRPAFGFTKNTEHDGTGISVGLSLPLGMNFSGTTGPVFTPYLSPALGFGRVSDDGDSESGMRPVLGGGFAISGRQAPLSVHFGFNKVFIDDGEIVYGLGVSIGRR